VSTPAIDDLQALKTCLETITVTNGYQTDVAAVAIGRAALAVGSKAALPVITLTTVRDVPSDGGADIEAGNKYQTWTRIAQMEALVDGSGDWESALDAVLDDVRRALTQFKKPLRIGAADFVPPADAGSTASFVMPLQFLYELNYFD